MTTTPMKARPSTFAVLLVSFGGSSLLSESTIEHVPSTIASINVRSLKLKQTLPSEKWLKSLDADRGGSLHGHVSERDQRVYLGVEPALLAFGRGRRDHK